MKSRRVLVIDDSRPVAGIFSELLRSLGHIVETIYDPLLAHGKVCELRPQIVFCDISMPRLSGYDVARLLRADADLSDTVLVAMTGYGQPEDRERALRSGFDYHVTKPAEMSRLAELFGALDRRDAGR